MLTAPIAKQPLVDAVEVEPPASEQGAGARPARPREPLVLALDASARRAIFRGGIQVTGANYQLLRVLADAGEFVQASALADLLRIEETTLRTRVSRVRKFVATEFDVRFRVYLDEDDIIENEEWAGYRLNPFVVLVEPSQLAAMSQLDPSDVTSPDIRR
jgi:hypothetical protein